MQIVKSTTYIKYTLITIMKNDKCTIVITQDKY